MARTTAYSMKNVAAVLDGQAVTGFWDGDDAVVVENVDDVGEMMVGVDGTGLFSQAVSEAATITVRLQHTSATHRTLLLRLAQQQTPGMRVTGFPFSVMDVDSGEGGACAEAFVQKAPNDEKGKNANVREWVLVTAAWKREIPNVA